jgi:hypothetical protein
VPPGQRSGAGSTSILPYLLEALRVKQTPDEEA